MRRVLPLRARQRLFLPLFLPLRLFLLLSLTWWQIDSRASCHDDGNEVANHVMPAPLPKPAPISALLTSDRLGPQ